MFEIFTLRLRLELKKGSLWRIFAIFLNTTEFYSGKSYEME